MTVESSYYTQNEGVKCEGHYLVLVKLLLN